MIKINIITGLSVDAVYRFPMQTELSRLLKFVLINLNYRIGVHMNFAQSRKPALVCSPQSECGCHQARSQVGTTGNATTVPKFSG